MSHKTGLKRPAEILLIEDEPGDQWLTSDLITSCGIPSHLNVAGDASEALKMLENGLKPDLVLLDLKLPGMSGEDFVRLYHPPQVPIVVFSDSSKPEQKQHLIDLGATEFIQKPVALGGYRDAILRLCDKWLSQFA